LPADLGLLVVGRATPDTVDAVGECVDEALRDDRGSAAVPAWGLDQIGVLATAGEGDVSLGVQAGPVLTIVNHGSGACLVTEAALLR